MITGSTRYLGRVWLYGAYPCAWRGGPCHQTRSGLPRTALGGRTTHSWMNRFRRIVICWEKKPENYIVLLNFACALIAFRAAGLFG